MKTCSRCKTEKPLSEFQKNKSIKDGFQTECRICRKERAAKWYAGNKPAAAKRSAAYRKANQQKCRIAYKKYDANNKERKAVYAIKYRSTRRDLLNAQAKAWKGANKEKCKVKAQQWVKENKDKINLYKIKHKVLHRDSSNKYAKRQSAELSDNYLKAQIARYGSLTREQIPVELIEAKRLHLQIRRKLKDLKA